jgi:metal-dependent hydrolase (beta-lactamase superfamily II)
VVNVRSQGLVVLMGCGHAGAAARPILTEHVDV